MSDDPGKARIFRPGSSHMPALAPIPLTADELAASMARTLLEKGADIADPMDCASLLMEQRFLAKELVAHLHEAMAIAQESREANRRKLFDIVKNVPAGEV